MTGAIPRSRDKLFHEAVALREKGEYEKAIEILEELVLKCPEWSDVYRELGDTFITLKRNEAAEKALDYAMKLNSKDCITNYLLGFLYSRTDRWEESVKLLTIADSSMPNTQEIIRCLGWSHYHNGQHSKGLQMVQRAVDMHPNDIMALLDLGMIFSLEKQYIQAHKAFTKILKLGGGAQVQARALEMLEMIKEILCLN